MAPSFPPQTLQTSGFQSLCNQTPSTCHLFIFSGVYVLPNQVVQIIHGSPPLERPNRMTKRRDESRGLSPGALAGAHSLVQLRAWPLVGTRPVPDTVDEAKN